MTEGHVVYPSNPSHTGYPSYPPYHDSLSNQTRKAWHPKITPYRLAILTTTVGLGTAKAIVTQKGGAIVSTTLEWVAGMLLSLLFLVLSDYESREDVVPPYLSWLFKPDCMDLIWKLLAFFSIDRPVYVSDELPSDSASDDAKSASPDLTPYRILVSGTVTAFGLSKAMLGYSNQLTAVTWTDWALAVPVTTLYVVHAEITMVICNNNTSSDRLYVLGLYEYNSTKVLPDLFCGDQSEILKSGDGFDYRLSTIFLPICI
ncbi:hypothetical protein CVT25_000630 [Psilocybe cyanescens]|uniref:Uncharacterized protein n=1 Tax=Psilocybe cyanescens TaxID=93625 RepID=A0A409WZH4_PSICY|nr:hypothetical protein CVT25_000630 [Psilocybe cyanescens]